MTLIFPSADDVIVETWFDDEMREAHARWRYRGVFRDHTLAHHARAGLPEGGEFTLKCTDEDEFTLTGRAQYIPSTETDEAWSKCEADAIAQIKIAAARVIKRIKSAEQCAVRALSKGASQ